MLQKINELEIIIKEKETEYETLLEQVLPIKRKIVDEIVTYLQAKIKSTLEYEIKTKTSITNSLGLEKLKPLKIEMAEIIGSISNHKEDMLNDSTWSISDDYITSLFSRKGDNFGIKYNESKSIADNIYKTLKVRYSVLGELLYKYGYIKLENEGSWNKVDGKISYRYGFSDTQKINSLIREYQEIFNSAFELKEKNFNLKKELEQTKALYLWEQA